MKNINPLKLHRGMSSIEILVIVGIMAVILAILIPNFTRMLYKYRVQTAATQIATNLRFARNACIKRKVPFRAVINTEEDSPPNTYRIEYQISGNWIAVEGLDFNMPVNILIEKCDPAGPILFKSNGTVNNEYEIDVRIPQGIEYRIELNQYGVVSTRCNKNC